jgi:hypothetical protein
MKKGTIVSYAVLYDILDVRKKNRKWVVLRRTFWPSAVLIFLHILQDVGLIHLLVIKTARLYCIWGQYRWCTCSAYAHLFQCYLIMPLCTWFICLLHDTQEIPHLKISISVQDISDPIPHSVSPHKNLFVTTQQQKLCRNILMKIMLLYWNLTKKLMKDWSMELCATNQCPL